jgi:hypothetical protein
MFLSAIPHPGIAEWEIFTAQQDSTTSRGWQTWLKPPGFSFIYIFAAGGGGGGGGGGSTAATARTGGGGGSSGGLSCILMPAFLLPDIIHVRPGMGGAGGSAASNGSVGVATYVATQPVTSNNGLILSANGGNLGAAAGTAGASPGAGGGGASGTGGVTSGNGGNAGGAGGANTGAVGTGPQFNATIVTGGGGGGSSGTGDNVFAGGGWGMFTAPNQGPALYPAIPGGSAGVSGTTVGGNGRNGFGHGAPLKEFFSRHGGLLSTGGSGGGSGGASNGGSGGNGGAASGGGGGGAGAVGGAGGRGGDGFVIIGAF